MIVKQIGKYRLLKDLQVRTPISIGTIPAGSIITITQISKDYRQVIGPELKDWHYYELPVKREN